MLHLKHKHNMISDRIQLNISEILAHVVTGKEILLDGCDLK